MKNALLVLTLAGALALSSQIAFAEPTATVAIAEVQATPVLLTKCSSQEPGTPSVSSLGEILEAINNQMIGRFQTIGMFSVVAGNELRKAGGRSQKVEVTEAPPVINTPPVKPANVFRPTELAGTWIDSKGKRHPATFTRVESQTEPSPGLFKDRQTDGLDLQGKWAGRTDDGKYLKAMEITRNSDGTFGGTFQNIEDGKRDAMKLVEYIPPFLRIERANGAKFIAELKDNKTPVQKPLVQEKLRPPDVYDLKDSNTVEQFKRADIKYFLAMMLEDFNDQTLDLMQGKSSLGYLNSQSGVKLDSQSSGRLENDVTHARPNSKHARRQASGNYENNRSLQGSTTQSVQAGVVQLDSNIRKQQTVRLSLRYRLLDATTGDLLKSESRSFATNRIYTALAQGQNAKSTGDIYRAAAHDAAEWAAVNVGELAFPIQVLGKNNDEITINRGTESGIRIGQVYGIYTLGKKITDPATGEVLGREEITAGKAAVTELHPKFSKAKVLNDTGIYVGATLRPTGGK